MTQQFLKKMSSSDKSNVLIWNELVPAHIQPTISSQILYVCKTLHMNELEIALWSVCVDGHTWRELELDSNMILLLIAFQVKVLSDPNLSNILIARKKAIFTIKNCARCIVISQDNIAIGFRMGVILSSFLLTN